MSKINSIISSERLDLSLMDEADAELLFELDQNPLVMKYINGGKPSSMNLIIETMIPRMKTFRNPTKGWGLWKVIVRESDEFIGWVLVRPMHFFSENIEVDNLELGWRFKQTSWGLGYATEAAKQMQTALTQANLAKRFSAIAMPGNQASINIMKKLGMNYIKTDIHEDPLGNVEVVYYSCEVS